MDCLTVENTPVTPKAKRSRVSNLGDDLYFVKAGMGCAPIKIGRSVNVWNRLGKMQADNHEELNCMVRLVGRGFEELAWHAAFSEHWIRGEWYRWSLELDEAMYLASTGEQWWNHLKPPVKYLRDVNAGREGFDDAVVDWHIAIQLYCHAPK